MAVQDFTLYDTLVRSAESGADTVAVIEPDGTTRSYGEMLSRVDALATGLAAVGLERGHRIAVLASNSVMLRWSARSASSCASPQGFAHSDSAPVSAMTTAAMDSVMRASRAGLIPQDSSTTISLSAWSRP